MCENKVSFWVARHVHGYREVQVKCGRTDPWGGRAMCNTCADNATVRAEIAREEAAIAADNWASRSAGWGDW